MEVKTLQLEISLAATLAERDMMVLDLNQQVIQLKMENEELKKRLDKQKSIEKE